MSDLDGVPDYLLAREIERRECAANFHEPDRAVRQIGYSVAVVAWCRCGKVAWRPETISA